MGWLEDDQSGVIGGVWVAEIGQKQSVGYALKIILVLTAFRGSIRPGDASLMG
jgi:hypothetical protein